MKLKWIALLALLTLSLWLVRIPRQTTAIPRAPEPKTLAPAATNQSSSALTFKEWLASPNDLNEGRALAEVRREAMRRLVKENPAQAFAESLSWSQWLAIPEQLRPFVERPFSADVDFEVLPDCPPADADHHSHRVFFEGQWRKAHVFGARQHLTTKYNLPARGIILDDEVVLSESAFERLSGDDVAAASQLFGSGADLNRSWVSGKAIANEGRTILMAGNLYSLADADEEAALGGTLAQAEKSFHPQSVAMAMSAGTAAAGTIAFNLESSKGALVAASTWTETAKTTLAVRISYSSAPAAYSFTVAELTTLLNNASNTLKTMSYGKTWLVPTIATVALPNSQSFYETGGPDSIVSATRTALNQQGINPDNYNFVIHAHPQSNFGYAGLGQIGAGISWLNGNVSLEVTVHELGHNYGLGHSHYWTSLTGLGGLGHSQPGDGAPPEKEEYGDTLDIMGGSTLPAGHYTAHGKAALNWIEQKEIINVITNGIYRVYRFDHKDARTNANAKLALKIAAPGGEEYWVSHRRLFTGNPALLRGASITRADGPGDQSLIDTTPLSRFSQSYSSDRDDSALAIGKSFQDSLGTVRITTINQAGILPLEYIDVQVTFLDTGSYSLFTSVDFATNGLVGSYINTSLRGRAVQDDWRTGVAGTVRRRIDRSLSFTSDGWGARAPLGLTSGTDANWDNFSAQWDGFLVVRRPIRLATISDDSSRLWIDLDKNGAFGTSAPEYVNNHWGTGQGATRGDLSPLIPPGTYSIRIQYEEGVGGNYFVLTGAELPFQFFTTATGSTPGLIGSYFASGLRSVTQNDWRASQSVAGTRTDVYPAFSVNGWGSLASVGLTSANGTDSDWNSFSVQWDGYISNSVPIKIATASDDYSRMWIDLDKNGTFLNTLPELINNGWGGANGQGMTLGQVSQTIPPGRYQVRIQYEEGAGGNNFLVLGAEQFPADAGVVLTGLNFTGSNSVSTPRTMTNEFTIQFWFRTSQTDGTSSRWTDGMGMVDAGSPGFGISLGEGQALFGVNDGSLDQMVRSQFIADGSWHHLTARRDTNTGLITLLIDGLPVGSAPGGTNSLTSIANLTLGSLSGGTNFYIGNIEQLKLWTTARSDAQVFGDYYTARTAFYSSEAAPTVRLAKFQPNSYQVFWEATSSYRILEAATSINGPWITLPTDQNSTNVPVGAFPNRYFRVKK